MIRKILMIVSAACFVFAVPARAQAPDAGDGSTTTGETAKEGDSDGPPRFWQASVGGGHFMVALDRIVSVSRHKYLLDGAVIVDEVTVDTVGQALARFYYIEPVTSAAGGSTASDVTKRAQELLDKASERVGGGLEDMVGKKYGVTSHAKSIEYRIMSANTLTALYGSVRKAWETGRGRQFNAK